MPLQQVSSSTGRPDDVKSQLATREPGEQVFGLEFKATSPETFEDPSLSLAEIDGAKVTRPVVVR